jgi:signal transduction histidine kinase
MSRLARHPLALDAVLAVALGALAQSMVWRGHVDGPRALVAPLFLLLGPPLVVRRRLPLVPIAAAVTAIVVQAVTTGDAPEGAGLLLPVVVALYSVAAYGSRRQALLGLALAVVGAVVHDVNDPQVRTGEQIWGDVFFEIAVFAVWLGGLFVRSRRELTALERRAEELERRHAQAVADERARIARELHDVIAHNISVVVVQAVAAMGILDRQPERARQPLERIEQSGHEALAELRRLLGILREDDDQRDLTPQPALGDLETLIDGVRSAGLPVELHVEGPVRPLPRGVDLSAYRILQEALTNVLKHAGPASARVSVRYGGDWLELEVIDDGRAEGAWNGAGSGHGLIGMRERVALYGGDLEAGPQDGAGFVVRARLPIAIERA